MIKQIKWTALITALLLTLSACGGAGENLSTADLVSTVAAQTAESMLTQTVMAGGSLSTPTPLPILTETPVPTATDTGAVPTNAMAVDPTGEDSATEIAATPGIIIPTATDVPNGGGSSTGCVWAAAYNGEDPPYDGSQFRVERTGIEKTWYVTNTSRDAAGNGCAWTRSGVYLRWVGTYRYDTKRVNWSTMSQADKATYNYVNDFGANITEFLDVASVPYLTKVPITVTMKMPRDPGYYLIEWLIYGPDGNPIFVDGGALWIELHVFSPDG